MRVSTRQQYATYQSDMARALERYTEAQGRVSTGKKVNTLSDAPYDGAVLLSLKNLKARTEQYTKNVDGARRTMTLAENVMSEVSTTLNKAYEITVTAANSTTSQEARNAMIEQINQMQSRLVDLGNSRGVNGEYLFAGQKTDTKPFTFVLGALSFNGDDLPILTETGPGETLSVNTLAGGAFQSAHAALENLKTSLQGGDIGALSGVDLPAIQGVQNSFRQLRGDIGSRMQTADTLKADYSRRSDEFGSKISDIEDVDLTEALVSYKQAETAYQAALSVASQGFRLSLLDFIRG